jgi:hypothetical protein
MSHSMPHSIWVWVVYLTPKIERIISLLSTSPEGEVRCRCQKWYGLQGLIIIIMPHSMRSEMVLNRSNAKSKTPQLVTEL